jgi:hypothetical protein
MVSPVKLIKDGIVVSRPIDGIDQEGIHAWIKEQLLGIDAAGKKSKEELDKAVAKFEAEIEARYQAGIKEHILNIGPTDDAKYDTALKLYFTCLGVRHDSVAKHKAMDDLISYMNDNFPDPVLSEETKNYTNILFWGPARFDVLKQDISPASLETIWPIAIMKLALCTDHLSINPSELKTFNLFHKKYNKFLRFCGVT